MASNASIIKTPRRFLFIASVGNKGPYRQTRHSAGHSLLDAIVPLLPTRVPLVSTQTFNSPGPLFYKTWSSPSFMNESGPKLVSQLSQWMSKTQTEVLEQRVRHGLVALPQAFKIADAGNTEWERRGIDPRLLTQFDSTLVILHDELEAPLGKVKVRRGGPEASSLRGHRGLISVMESLRGKGLWPRRGNSGAHGDLSILRIGVGIGRPSSRDRNSVSDYVLTKMDAVEMEAVRNAATSVMDILADELYRDGKGI